MFVLYCSVISHVLILGYDTAGYADPYAQQQYGYGAPAAGGYGGYAPQGYY